MIHVILDTNALASGALERPGAIAQILHYWRRGHLVLVISDHILEELERTLRKPYFANRIAEKDRRDFLSLFRSCANMRRSWKLPGRCRLSCRGKVTILFLPLPEVEPFPTSLLETASFKSSPNSKEFG